jgi:hypothetical protein
MTKLLKYLTEDAERKERIKDDLEELELKMSSSDKRLFDKIIKKHVGEEIFKLEYSEMIKKVGKNKLFAMYDEIKKNFKRYL